MRLDMGESECFEFRVGRNLIGPEVLQKLQVLNL